MNRALVTIALIAFGSTLFVRAVDPIVLKIADGFAVAPSSAALLITAFALPYAMMQPILGAMADAFGKPRLMVACLTIGVCASLASAFAPTFPLLMATRVISGAACGGVFPVAVATVGDLFPISQRQVAIGRVVATGMMGNLVGATLAGIVADFWGWRGAFIVTGVLAFAMLVPSFGFGRDSAPAERPKLMTVLTNYRVIFTNPLAKVCFGAVFFDAMVIFGLFPYMATILHAQGETRATIVGLIIAGFGFGAVIYSFIVRRLLDLFGDRWLMAIGGFIMAGGLLLVPLQLSWPVLAAVFLVTGVAFFMLHGSIQIYVTELAPAARASAMAMHSSSFFFGQAVGPVAYGLGFAHLGSGGTFAVSAAVIAIVGVWAAAGLKRTHPR
jgi:predicted MFS family arabinose efflux permease